MRSCKKAVTVFYLFLLTIVVLTSCKLNKEENPKYIFLFIGDGMGYPQIQLTADYLGTIGHMDTVKPERLSFMNFPVSGCVSNYDLTSFIPDSASSGSSIASGEKVRTGTINSYQDETYETIAEKLKKRKDFKIGMITSVNINHTTPADFFAHQVCRKLDYEIGRELVLSKFDYFAGGGFLKPSGKDGTEESLYDLAEKAGYQFLQSKKELESFHDSDKLVIVKPDKPSYGEAMSYSIDSSENDVTLSQFVKNGVRLLDNKKGFFMMVEGGKIDWSCHNQDAATCIHDIMAFDEAVEEAIAFYKKHPAETLILVTADHETGGLTLGYTQTNYSLYLDVLQQQDISYEVFEKEYVERYKRDKTDFSEAMKEVEKHFGLTEKSGTMTSLSYYELQQLKKAYETSLQFGTRTQEEMTEEEYIRYGNSDPFTTTILHILANKAGVNFSTYAHTGLCVPVFALGKGQEQFNGYYDNTDICKKLKQLTGLE